MSDLGRETMSPSNLKFCEACYCGASRLTSIDGVHCNVCGCVNVTTISWDDVGTFEVKKFELLRLEKKAGKRLSGFGETDFGVDSVGQQ